MLMMQKKNEQTIYTELTMLAETKSGYYAIPWSSADVFRGWLGCKPSWYRAHYALGQPAALPYFCFRAAAMLQVTHSSDHL
jgi:hypothetical protein